MTTKTSNPTILFPTLRGAFEQPKMIHRRDFLRENKLSLRELQKITSQKLTQQKQERESRRYKYLQNFHKIQDHTLDCRTLGQCTNKEHSKRQCRLAAGISEGDDGSDCNVMGIKEKRNCFANRRAYSQQRNKLEKVQKESTCCCHRQQQRPQNTEERMHRSASAISVLSKAESCDKEIQTEDIHDEDFLYEALKKCSSSDIYLSQKQKSNNQFNILTNKPSRADSNCNLQQYETKLNSVHSCEQTSCTPQYRNEYNKTQHNHPILQDTTRSYNQTQNGEIENNVNEDLNQDFQNLKLADDIRREHESQLSARSRQTLCSTGTKKSVHKLGSRENLRLPRYLEKEKREKEEEHIRELSKDRNCPLGHYVLDEEERLKALQQEQEKMASLINELNHMPMTMETLRIRNRKVEIEKELTQIEANIRLYSKPKVYIPKRHTQY